MDGDVRKGADTADGKSPVSTQPQEVNYRPCPRTSRAGVFNLVLKNDSGGGYTSFQGSVKDGPDPLEVLEEVASAGACRVLNRVVRQCSPSCSGNTPYCGLGGKCFAYPKQEDVGLIKVTGVGDGFVSTPSATKAYTNDSSIAYPGVKEGVEIVLSAEGGIYRPFMLSVKGVAPLEIADQKPMVRKGAPLRLSWTAPGTMTGARVHIVLSLDNHGSTPQQIECDAPDTGSFEVPSQLVDSLIALGLSGFPSATIARRSVESTALPPGCVEFNVRAEAVLSVEVEGLTSCSTNEDCPSGKTCQPSRSCE